MTLHLYPQSCYELVWAGRKDLFTIGYCWSFRRRSKNLFLIEPFIKAFYRNEMGSIMCRGDWPNPTRIREDAYRIHKVPTEPWMTVHLSDLVATEVLVSEVATSLPLNGFRRGF